jgi:hypothetical protein
VSIDTGGWQAVGETANSKYFLIEDGVLGAVPRPGSVDDHGSAREEARFQNAYWKRTGTRGAAVVFLDNVVSQDKDARHVYQTEIDPRTTLGAGLVGGTILSRAIGAFFLGIASPRYPIRMFGTLDDALVWCRHLIEAAKERER